jgi:hypothetical protein
MGLSEGTERGWECQGRGGEGIGMLSGDKQG